MVVELFQVSAVDLQNHDHIKCPFPRHRQAFSLFGKLRDLLGDLCPLRDVFDLVQLSFKGVHFLGDRLIDRFLHQLCRIGDLTELPYGFR